MFDPAESKFTLGAWFKVTNLTTQHTLLAQQDGSGVGRAWLLLTTDGKLASDLGGTRLTGADSITTGQWHHAALTYDGTTLSLYLDGNLTAQADRHLESSDGDLIVGADGTLIQNLFVGALDEVVIYNRALSAEELYDIATPLTTAVTSASIRFRHAKDAHQAVDAEPGTPSRWPILRQALGAPPGTTRCPASWKAPTRSTSKPPTALATAATSPPSGRATSTRSPRA